MVVAGVVGSVVFTAGDLARAEEAMAGRARSRRERFMVFVEFVVTFEMTK